MAQTEAETEEGPLPDEARDVDEAKQRLKDGRDHIRQLITPLAQRLETEARLRQRTQKTSK